MDTYYSIGEAADLLGVSVPTLRYYEREGLIIPMRKSSRHRFYSPADLERIRCLRETINTKKVSIAGVRRLLALIPCWKMYNCAVQERESCPAFLGTDMPCWSLSGKPGACGTADCRQCPVYHDAADCSMIKQIIVTSTISSGSTI